MNMEKDFILLAPQVYAMGPKTVIHNAAGRQIARKDRAMNTITYLFLVKACFLLSLGVDIILFTFNLPVLGTIALFGGLIIMWRLYRCPECKCHLDFRLSLSKIEYCPSCGCDFISHKK